MKIVDLQVIPFRTSPTKWYRYGEIVTDEPNGESVQTVTKIITDEDAEGYCFGGYRHGDWWGLPADMRAALKGEIKSFVLGPDPIDRENLLQIILEKQ